MWPLHSTEESLWQLFWWLNWEGPGEEGLAKQWQQNLSVGLKQKDNNDEGAEISLSFAHSVGRGLIGRISKNKQSKESVWCRAGHLAKQSSYATRWRLYGEIMILATESSGQTVPIYDSLTANGLT